LLHHKLAETPSCILKLVLHNKKNYTAPFVITKHFIEQLMTFRDISKPEYNRRLKATFFAICAYMLITALAISTVLIHFFGAENGNFWLNVAGVIGAAIGLFFIYKQVKGHPYLSDIIYIRAIKAQLNYIYRKQHKLKAAAEQGDKTAIAILDYSYRASIYVYQLDDNTLTIEELTAAQAQLQSWIEKYQVASLETYHQALLKNY